MNAPDVALQQRVTRLMHKQPVAWHPARGGYTPAQRWIVSFDDGSNCFVKAAAGLPDSPIDEWLRREYSVYSRVQAPFLPRLLAWDDDGVQPLLILEDLSEAHWPPPWRPGDVDAVLETLEQMHATALEVPSFDGSSPDLETHWTGVAEDPEPFLSLQLCSRPWLEAALPRLIETAGDAVLSGDDLIHFDIRSDNICFHAGHAVLVDWNFAARGNGEIDIAGWLPSLHSEGGPLPEHVLPDAPHWAALVSGFFAARAGGPPIPQAPRVRQVQLSQLRSALPWAVRALGLPPLDGPNAP